jgi:DNA-binding MarR family transcriptional regulator
LSISNEAKFETLNFIDEFGFARSSEIAEFRDVTHGCQSTLLRRYWKQGLLHRFSGEGKEKIYTLSERGEERLDWLRGQFEPELEDEMLDSELFEYLSNVKRCRVKKDDELILLLKNIKKCRVIRTEHNYVVIERE